jgi:hypothetical protein
MGGKASYFPARKLARTKIFLLYFSSFIQYNNNDDGRSQWPRGLRYGPSAARLLGLRVRIPPEHRYLPLVSVACVVRYSPLRGADHSSRGVLPSVVYLHECGVST